MAKRPLVSADNRTASPNKGGGTGAKRTTKAGAKRRGGKSTRTTAKPAAKRSAAKATKAQQPTVATTGPQLLGLLKPRGFNRGQDTLYRAISDTKCPFKRPTRDKPIDVDAFEKWARQFRPNWFDAPKLSDPGDAEPDAEADREGGGDDEDFYAPPPASVMRALRRHDPDTWASVVQKMRRAEKLRLENEIRVGRYVRKDEEDRRDAAKIAQVQSTMRQLPRAVAPRLVDMVMDEMRQHVRASKKLDRSCGKLEALFEDALGEALEAVCRAYAGRRSAGTPGGGS